MIAFRCALLPQADPVGFWMQPQQVASSAHAWSLSQQVASTQMPHLSPKTP
jgi:hypothetical protein